jgi:hypothetical protein
MLNCFDVNRRAFTFFFDDGAHFLLHLFVDSSSSTILSIVSEALSSHVDSSEAHQQNQHFFFFFYLFSFKKEKLNKEKLKEISR